MLRLGAEMHLELIYAVSYLIERGLLLPGATRQNLTLKITDHNSRLANLLGYYWHQLVSPTTLVCTVVSIPTVLKRHTLQRRRRAPEDKVEL